MDGCDYSFSGLKTAVRSHWHPHCGQSAHNSPSAELKPHLLTPTIFQSTMLFVHNMTLCFFFFQRTCPTARPVRNHILLRTLVEKELPSAKASALAEDGCVEVMASCGKL